MRRADLEHVVAAAADVVGERDFVVVGSQAILASHSDAPDALLRSQEADLYPRHAPEKSIEIDGVLGDGSPFHQAFGYYAHGVGPETAKAPAGWEDRLVAVEILARGAGRPDAVAFCLEPHDLVLAKLAANRERDWAFAADALAAGFVDAATLARRAVELPVDAQMLDTVRRGLTGLTGPAARGR